MNWQNSIFFALFIISQIEAATHLGGVLFQNTVWTNVDLTNTYYLLQNVQIPKNVSLTILPGVKISFALGDFEILVKGTLNIIGSAENPVIFKGGSATHSKSMIRFRSTSLSMSTISYAHFHGPKKALQLVDAPDGIQENNGTLLIQSSTFLDNTGIGANGVYPRSYNLFVPALQFQSCIFKKTTISNANIDSEPIIIRNSEIYESIFYPRASNEGIQINDCKLTDITVNYDLPNSQNLIRLNNVTAKGITLMVLTDGRIMYQFIVNNSIVEDFILYSNYYSGASAYHTMVTFERSTIANISISFTLAYQSYSYRSFAFTVRNCTYTGGTLNFTYNEDRTSLYIENSEVRNVDIIGQRSQLSGEPDFTSKILTLRNVVFIDGSIIFENGLSQIDNSNITLSKPPLSMNGRSTIICSSISRSDSIPQANTTGVNAKDLQMSKSTIQNFATGLQIASTNVYYGSIWQSNFIDNSDYNIQNRGPFNILVSDTYWGTNDSTLISSKIFDYWDNINYGYVVSTSDALNRLPVEVSCLPLPPSIGEVETMTADPDIGITTAHLTSDNDDTVEEVM